MDRPEDWVAVYDEFRMDPIGRYLFRLDRQFSRWWLGGPQDGGDPSNDREPRHPSTSDSTGAVEQPISEAE